MLYQTGLPSNVNIPLPLFVRIELLCYCCCIRQQTRVATNTAIAAQLMTKEDNGLAIRLSGHNQSCDLKECAR